MPSGGRIFRPNADLKPASQDDLVPSVPTPVWGRGELHTGDIWNSNSLISWLLARAGVDTQNLQPPPGGRVPGWEAGLVVARRQVGSGPTR
jgi:hypothetical protein